MSPATVVVSARGHKNVVATHNTTLEVTRGTALTKRGDCVIAVEANRAVIDLPFEFKQAARRDGARITIAILAGNLKDVVQARGSPQLTFTHPNDLVVRKSGYVCRRTLAIKADKAAKDLSRKLVEKLREPNQEIIVKLAVEDY